MTLANAIAAERPALLRYAKALAKRNPNRRHIADDLVQDALVRALEKQHTYQHDTNLRGWLMAILHSVYVNGVRNGDRRSNITYPMTPEDETLRPAPNTSPASRLELQDVDRAFGQIPEIMRRVVWLDAVEGLSYEEMAATLRIPVGTVRSRLSRARDALRRMTDNAERKNIDGRGARFKQPA